MVLVIWMVVVSAISNEADKEYLGGDKIGKYRNRDRPQGHSKRRFFASNIRWPPSPLFFPSTHNIYITMYPSAPIRMKIQFLLSNGVYGMIKCGIEYYVGS